MADNNVVIQMLDLKGPLKGKGVYLAQWRRDAEDRLAEIYAQMEELAQRTRVVEGRRSCGCRPVNRNEPAPPMPSPIASRRSRAEPSSAKTACCSVK